MCFEFQSVEARADSTKRSVNHLKILAGCEIVIAMIKMFVFKDIVGGFYELISCLILWMSWYQLSFCLCLFYIVFICIMGSITYGVLLLTPVQNNQPFFGDTGLEHTVVVFTIIFMFFYAFAAYITFKAYKEFKAEQYEMGGAGNGFFGAQQGGGRGQAVGGASFSQGGNNQNYGTNYSYGGSGSGDNEAYYPPSSNNVNQATQPSNQNNITINRSGGNNSQYFSGKGVRIG